VQGDLNREFEDVKTFSRMAAAYGGRVAEIETTRGPGVEIPPMVGIHLATHGIKKFEAALSRAGFHVIPYQTIASTPSYREWYGNWAGVAVVERGSFDVTSMAAGWTAFAPQGLMVEAPGGLVAINSAHEVWPETEAIKKIRDDLRTDVLFLLIGHRLFTHEIVTKEGQRTRQGKIGSMTMAEVVDPELVGHGLGDSGHVVVTLDAKVTPTEAPELIKGDPAGLATNWSMLVPDAEAINEFTAEAMAVAMKDVRNLK
jgi:hypothetical protein